MLFLDGHRGLKFGARSPESPYLLHMGISSILLYLPNLLAGMLVSDYWTLPIHVCMGAFLMVLRINGGGHVGEHIKDIVATARLHL